MCKPLLLKFPLWREFWAFFRSRQLHHSYARRRERYARIAQQHGIIYDEASVINDIRARLRNRGYTVTPKPPGDIHTFAFVPQQEWHHHLLPDLRELGPLTVFDYVSLGFDWREFKKADRDGLARRRAMNDMVLPALKAAHAECPVDWVFVYASGLEISASVIQRITGELGLPCVNMCLDDKHSWTGAWMGDHPAGQIALAPVFDLSWTSARVACEWYLVEGGRPLYMPEGFEASAYGPREVEQDIPVSFIGGAYGFRPAVIKYLRRNGVAIQTFGRGWSSASWVSDMVEIFNRSRINLGMGGIGYSDSLTNVKGRDFEIPGTGGGVYLTSFNPDLAQHFVIGEEILCYRNLDEMLELIRHYLARPEEARAIARRGRERCLREHRWLHRYQKVLTNLGILTRDLQPGIS